MWILPLYFKKGKIKNKTKNPIPKSYDPSRAAKLKHNRFTLTSKNRESGLQGKTPLCNKIPNHWRAPVNRGTALMYHLSSAHSIVSPQYRWEVRTISQKRSQCLGVWPCGTHDLQIREPTRRGSPDHQRQSSIQVSPITGFTVSVPLTSVSQVSHPLISPNMCLISTRADWAPWTPLGISNNRPPTHSSTGPRKPWENTHKGGSGQWTQSR